MGVEGRGGEPLRVRQLLIIARGSAPMTMIFMLWLLIMGATPKSVADQALLPAVRLERIFSDCRFA